RPADPTWRILVSHPYLAPVIDLVQAAGHAILPHWRSELQVHEKADASPVTAADLAAHHLLSEGLQALDASIPVLSEEACDLALAERAGGWSIRWTAPRSSSAAARNSPSAWR